MKLLSVLTPKFMKNLDNYFLLHHRLLWITKVHYVVYFTILATAITSALVWAYPLAPNSDLPSKEIGIFLSVLLMVPAMIFWIYKQTLFSIEKSYGQTFPFMEHLRFGIYLLIFGIFISLPVLFASLMQSKIANLVDKETIRNDVYHLNAGNPYFPTNRGSDILWDEDKLVIRDTKRDTKVSEYQLPELSDGRTSFNFKPFYLNYLAERTYPMNEDSESLTFRDLFLNTNSDIESLTLIANYIHTYHKYSKGRIALTPQEVLARYKKHETLSNGIMEGKSEIQNNLYQISEAQANKLVDKNVFVFLFSLAFSLSTLLLIFQNVKWLDFVLAAVSFGIGGFFFILTLIFFGEMTSSHSDSTMLFGILLAFGFFVFKSLQINRLQAYSRFKIFSLMFANVMSPFMLFLAIAWLTKAFHFPDYYMSEMELQGWLMASFALHTVMMMPIYRNLYLKMRSLPKI